MTTDYEAEWLEHLNLARTQLTAEAADIESLPDVLEWAGILCCHGRRDFVQHAFATCDPRLLTRALTRFASETNCVVQQAADWIESGDLELELLGESADESRGADSPDPFLDLDSSASLILSLTRWNWMDLGLSTWLTALPEDWPELSPITRARQQRQDLDERLQQPHLLWRLLPIVDLPLLDNLRQISALPASGEGGPWWLDGRLEQQAREDRDSRAAFQAYVNWWTHHRLVLPVTWDDQGQLQCPAMPEMRIEAVDDGRTIRFHDGREEFQIFGLEQIESVEDLEAPIEWEWHAPVEFSIRIQEQADFHREAERTLAAAGPGGTLDAEPWELGLHTDRVDVFYQFREARQLAFAVETPEETAFAWEASAGLYSERGRGTTEPAVRHRYRAEFCPRLDVEDRLVLKLTPQEFPDRLNARRVRSRNVVPIQDRGERTLTIQVDPVTLVESRRDHAKLALVGSRRECPPPRAPDETTQFADELLRKFKPALDRHIQRRRGIVDAEDSFSNLTEKIYGLIKRHGLEKARQTLALPYLRHMATNVMNDEDSKSLRRKETALISEPHEDLVGDIEAADIATTLELTDEERMILLLYLSDVQHEVTARQIGKSNAATRQIVSRLLRRIIAPQLVQKYSRDLTGHNAAILQAFWVNKIPGARLGQWAWQRSTTGASRTAATWDSLDPGEREEWKVRVDQWLSRATKELLGVLTKRTREV